MTSPIAAVRALRPDISPAEAREVVLAVLGAVREPVISALSARQAIYQNKADAADPMREDNYNQHDLFKHAAEAIGYATDEVIAALASLVAEVGTDDRDLGRNN